ncbi:YhbY family RNA-binding protein [Candidatus Woesearchaeota archaeon]|jgi:RNA-binding protein|nr:YhbY family RNA-binding protein [Candidatus Woesearchaeota archaeon]MBT6518333.1 YhbY family RNA-binding protein [Candidatus Woesearchaeota archaeon]MBT7366630.1 YhbY family RNA-binding protein [Candidatus Woesearchaeota archaeon]
MLTKERKQKLKSDARRLTPLIRIGKNGVTENILNELNTHLKKRQLIKLKLLPAYTDEISRADKKKICVEISKKTKSELIEQMGGVLVLYKSRPSVKTKMSHISK